jgi:1-deoxy-D-xylulose-5-phosphate reductoisomerase
VEAFLKERISFPAIAAVVEDTLSAMPYCTAASIHELLDIDRRSRSAASDAVRRRAGRRVTVTQS